MVKKYKLKNGLTVLLEPTDSVVSISAGLWIKAGSKYERSNQKGYAHFIEHMLFKGTENYSAKEIAQIVDRVGGQHNAVTSREYTCYYINVIADYIDTSLDLIADMYYRSLFDKDDIKKEKNVILEEISMYEDTPDEIIHDLFMECMLSKHPLGNPILGTADTINKANRNKLVTFFNQFYRNDNCILAIAGKFKEKKARALIEESFSSEINKELYNYEDISITPERVYRKHVERDLEQIHFCLGVDGLKKGDKDRWTLFTLSTILGGSVSSRLFQNIREKEGLCYSIYSFHSSYSDNGIFGIYCGTFPHNYEKVVAMILKECEDLVQNGITDHELTDVKAYIKGNLALSLESTEVKMGQLARNEITYGRNYTFEEIVEQINRVTIEDFKRICYRLFNNQRFTLVSIGKLKDLDDRELFLNI